MAHTLSPQTVTIPSGGNSVTLNIPAGAVLQAIETPVSFEGTTLTFATSNVSPGSPMYDGGSPYSLTSGASRFIPISKPEFFIGPSILKITSNVSGSPSNVAADRELKLYWVYYN